MTIIYNSRRPEQDDSDRAGRFPGNPSDWVQLDSGEEYAAMFDRRDGRLFHSHGEYLPYPLPVDGYEYNRMNNLHDICKQRLGDNFVGPVRDVLAAEGGRSKVVVDMCTGTGKWVEEMADRFPHVTFWGIDIVPLVTQHPKRNAYYEIRDLTTGTDWKNGDVDFVHARGVDLALKDYPRFIEEVARILKPGGLFLSVEWAPRVMPAANHPNAANLPEIRAFSDIVERQVSELLEIQPIAGHVHQILLNHPGYFRSVEWQEWHVPIGNWSNEREMGETYKQCVLELSRSYEPLLRRSGIPAASIRRLLQAFRTAVNSATGLTGVFYTVYARRV